MLRRLSILVRQGRCCNLKYKSIYATNLLAHLLSHAKQRIQKRSIF